MKPHDTPWRSRKRLWLSAVGGTILAMLASTPVLLAQRASREGAPRTVTPRGDLLPEEKRVTDIFERCSRSVVYVSPMVTRRQRTFFGYRDYTETGAGTGFVWDASGHIVTNFHVIRSASACMVTLADNSTYEARLVGNWPDKDVAVLQIEAPKDKLAPIAIGTSRDLRVGQSVLAIGNPYALDFTLTTGVVSALNRVIESANNRSIQGVIQTDAAINPGNSGGPLLDSAGRLIGMNTAIYTQSGSSAGIGFAVPVDTINRVVPQLIAYGKVIQPGLGATYADDYIAKRLELSGVLVLNVKPDGAADTAGIHPTLETSNGRIVLGDVIVRVGSDVVRDVDSLLNALEKHEIGEKITVTVEREGRTMNLPVTLEAE